MDDFFGVISSGLGGEGATQTEYVFVDLVGGSTFESAVRVGRLARLLLGGVDWDEAAEATGFLLLTRPCNERRNGRAIGCGRTPAGWRRTVPACADCLFSLLPPA